MAASSTDAHVGPTDNDPLDIRPAVNGSAITEPSSSVAAAPALPDEAAPERATGDPLDGIVSDPQMPAAIRVLAGRLRQAEQNMPGVMDLTQRVMTLGSNLEYVGKIVQAMSQQRALGEVQLERHTRSSALDLAIKAAKGKDGEVMDADLVTHLADAFLGWMKAGDA